MAGSRQFGRRRSAIRRRLEDLFAREEFRSLIKTVGDPPTNWLAFEKEHDIPSGGLPVIWHYLATGIIDYQLAFDGDALIHDETNNTINGMKYEDVFPPKMKFKPQVKVWLDPNSGKTETLESLSSMWDEFIEPGLVRMRGGKSEVVRSETNLNRKREILQMSKTLKPAEIAFKIGLTSKQVSDILYRERRKFRR